MKKIKQTMGNKILLMLYNAPASREHISKQFAGRSQASINCAISKLVSQSKIIKRKAYHKVKGICFVYEITKEEAAKIKWLKSIDVKTKKDLKDFKDFKDFKKVCKLHPFGHKKICLDMFNYGGDCCEEKCPIVDGQKAMEAFE
jgi:predicted transcriptional regulator